MRAVSVWSLLAMVFGARSDSRAARKQEKSRRGKIFWPVLDGNQMGGPGIPAVAFFRFVGIIRREGDLTSEIHYERNTNWSRSCGGVYCPADVGLAHDGHSDLSE